ncbi:response regulator [Sphingobacterium tabacisoli]|uniref:Response regulator n=1 Tax=Sphingobacterium tabacisoli TaxID=2044855 RepID=A0ABW5L4T4_9SPHI|nr:response regulator [Sphingobacterium tabacisoli]
MDSKTVLLFDDDIQILEVCTMILEFAGYTVVASANVVNVVEQIITANPDVILMDNWIPDIVGIRAA